MTNFSMLLEEFARQILAGTSQYGGGYLYSGEEVFGVNYTPNLHFVNDYDHRDQSFQALRETFKLEEGGIIVILSRMERDSSETWEKRGDRMVLVETWEEDID